MGIDGKPGWGFDRENKLDQTLSEHGHIADLIKRHEKNNGTRNTSFRLQFCPLVIGISQGIEIRLVFGNRVKVQVF